MGLYFTQNWVPTGSLFSHRVLNLIGSSVKGVLAEADRLAVEGPGTPVPGLRGEGVKSRCSGEEQGRGRDGKERAGVGRD